MLLTLFLLRDDIVGNKSKFENVSAIQFKIPTSRKLVELLTKINSFYNQLNLEGEKCTRIIHGLAHYYDILLNYEMPNIQEGLYLLRRAIGDLVFSRLHEHLLTRTLNACITKLLMDRILFYDPSVRVLSEYYGDYSKRRPIDYVHHAELIKLSDKTKDSFEGYRKAMLEESLAYAHRFREDLFQVDSSDDEVNKNGASSSSQAGKSTSQRVNLIVAAAPTTTSDQPKIDEPMNLEFPLGNLDYGTIVKQKLEKKKEFYKLLRQHQSYSVDLAALTYSILAVRQYALKNPHVLTNQADVLGYDPVTKSYSNRPVKRRTTTSRPKSDSTEGYEPIVDESSLGISSSSAGTGTDLVSNEGDKADSSSFAQKDLITEWLVAELSDIPDDYAANINTNEQFIRDPTRGFNRKDKSRQIPDTSLQSGDQQKKKQRLKRNDKINLPVRMPEDNINTFEELLSNEPVVESQQVLDDMFKSVEAEMMLSSATVFRSGDDAYKMVMGQIEVFYGMMFGEEAGAGVSLTGFPKVFGSKDQQGQQSGSALIGSGGDSCTKNQEYDKSHDKSKDTQQRSQPETSSQRQIPNPTSAFANFPFIDISDEDDD